MTREEWLTRAVVEIAKIFRDVGVKVNAKKIRVSCGWSQTKPSKSAGEAYEPAWMADKTIQIFISPAVNDSIEVLATLVHEVAHAAVGIDHGHKGPFVDAIRAVGLEGKPTTTVAGEWLTGELEKVVKVLKKYPHARMANPDDEKKKYTPPKRVKLVCDECDIGDYNVWISPRFLEEDGPPFCPSCRAEMTEGKVKPRS